MRQLCVSGIQDMLLKQIALFSNLTSYIYSDEFAFHSEVYSFCPVVAGPRQYVAPTAKATDPNLEEMRLNSTLAVKKKLQLIQVPAG